MGETWTATWMTDSFSFSNLKNLQIFFFQKMQYWLIKVMVSGLTTLAGMRHVEKRNRERFLHQDWCWDLAQSKGSGEPGSSPACPVRLTGQTSVGIELIPSWWLRTRTRVLSCPHPQCSPVLCSVLP